MDLQHLSSDVTVATQVISGHQITVSWQQLDLGLSDAPSGRYHFSLYFQVDMFKQSSHTPQM